MAQINLGNILSHIERFSSAGRTESGGVRRLGLTTEEFEAQKILIDEIRQMGIDVGCDEFANIVATIPGKHPEAAGIALICHLDTVVDGGHYDGALSAAAGLEILRIFREDELPLERNLHLLCFACGHSVRFGSGALGSRLWRGHIGDQELDRLHDAFGISAASALGEHRERLLAYGLKPISRKPQFTHVLEVHPEQGTTLESLDSPAGIVAQVAGVIRHKLTIRGHALHAGTTPMLFRHDALVGAAEIILAVEQEVKSCSSAGWPVATVGRIHNFPNATNVISDRTELYIDIRDFVEGRRDMASERILSRCREIAGQRALPLDIELVALGQPVVCTENIANQMQEMALARGWDAPSLVSGAWHDSVVFAGWSKKAIIYIRTPGGEGLSIKEFCPPEDIEKGCQLLLDGTEMLCGEISSGEISSGEGTAGKTT